MWTFSVCGVWLAIWLTWPELLFLSALAQASRQLTVTWPQACSRALAGRTGQVALLADKDACVTALLVLTRGEEEIKQGYFYF